MKKFYIIGKKLLPPVLGAAAGFAYWYFIGCSTGTCPLTSHWYASVVYGTIVGATFLLPGSKRKSAAGGSTSPLQNIGKD